MVVQRRKRLASKTRFHIHRSALSKKILTVKKKAKPLTNEKARDEYYRKPETKYEEYTKKENFFKPRKRYDTHAKQTTPQVLHCIPNWENAKRQVFSSSSSSYTSDNSTLSTFAEDSDKWAAAVNPEECGDLWLAAAAEPTVIHSDNITENSNNDELWDEEADPAQYEDAVQNSQNNPDDRDSIIIFEPPTILGHYDNTNMTFDPDSTIFPT